MKLALVCTLKNKICQPKRINQSPSLDFIFFVWDDAIPNLFSNGIKDFHFAGSSQFIFDVFFEF